MAFQLYPRRVPEHYLSVGVGVSKLCTSLCLPLMLGHRSGRPIRVGAFIGYSGWKYSAIATFVVFTRVCENGTFFPWPLFSQHATRRVTGWAL